MTGDYELPNRGAALSFGGFEIGRENPTQWFERLRSALPEALDSAKFFGSLIDDYRLASTAKVVYEPLHFRNLFFRSALNIGLFIGGNGYPDLVVGSNEAIIVVSRDSDHLKEQSRVICETLGVQVQPVAVVGDGKLIALGKTPLYLLTDETRRSIPFNGSRYNRRAVPTHECGYLSPAGPAFGIKYALEKSDTNCA